MGATVVVVVVDVGVVVVGAVVVVVVGAVVGVGGCVVVVVAVDVGAVTWTVNVTGSPIATLGFTSTSVVHPRSVTGSACAVPTSAAPAAPTRMAATARRCRHRGRRGIGIGPDLSADTDVPPRV